MPYRILFVLIFFSALQQAYARPVSYPGGWTVMQRNNADFHSLHVHYSPTFRYSVGLRSEYWNRDDYWLQSVAVNNLLRRWNNPDSQANLYLRSGLGIAYGQKGELDSERDPLAYSGLSFDWEDRRFFVSHQFRGIYAEDIDKSFHQISRVGIAPYIGDYGDIHTWLMLQAEHHPGRDNTYTLTPLIRFFKAEYLLELGLSTDVEPLVNFVIRF